MIDVDMGPDPLAKYPHIREFLKLGDTLQFNMGSAGMGRPAVGIVDTVSDCYISYNSFDENYAIATQCTHAEDSPPDAYHKHPCLAVLVNHDRWHDALIQLNRWLGEIMTKPFEFHRPAPMRHSLNAALGKPGELCIKDKE